MCSHTLLGSSTSFSECFRISEYRDVSRVVDILLILFCSSRNTWVAACFSPALKLPAQLMNVNDMSSQNDSFNGGLGSELVSAVSQRWFVKEKKHHSLITLLPGAAAAKC